MSWNIKIPTDQGLYEILALKDYLRSHFLKNSWHRKRQYREMDFFFKGHIKKLAIGVEVRDSVWILSVADKRKNVGE